MAINEDLFNVDDVEDLDSSDEEEAPAANSWFLIALLLYFYESALWVNLAGFVDEDCYFFA